MGLVKVVAVTLSLLGSALSVPVEERSVQAKSCDANGMCYTEWASPEGISYRIAIPDSAKAAPFDIAISITAPVKTVGWAGIAWGGVMANNPLAVAWANGNSVMISSRSSAGHTPPAAFADTTYKLLPSSSVNATHFKVDAICTGCSSWTVNKATGSLSPTSASVSVAYAQAAKAPTDPKDAASAIGRHDKHAKFTVDMTAAKLASFEDIVAKASK